jgi:CopG family nickel-responsive transcriptional regulator
MDVREPLVRFSVAIGGELLRRFDQYREEHQYPNRSEAVRGLMRDALIEEAIENEESPAMGVVTLVYNHHAGRISDILTEIQHRQLDSVVTTTHVHLDVERCLEVILLRGSVKIVRELANALIGTKGVETGELVLTSAYAMPESNADLHGHEHSHAHDQHHHDHPSARIKKQKRKPKTS